jgi:hypothetical protein
VGQWFAKKPNLKILDAQLLVLVKQRPLVELLALIELGNLLALQIVCTELMLLTAVLTGLSVHPALELLVKS